jgi:hypothetical protein
MLPAEQKSQKWIIIEDRRARSTLRSIIFPGWGQIYNNKARGYIFSGIAGISLGYFIYSSVQLRKTHQEYLKAYTEDDIERKYASYNKWYIRRNNSLLVYSGSWTLSLIDILFDPFSKENRLLISPNSSSIGLIFSF